MISMSKFYPYLAFGMAAHFNGYETEHMTLLFKDLEPHHNYGAIIENPSVQICPSCRYPTDSVHYQNFLTWLNKTKEEQTPCHRCQDADLYRLYVNTCIEKKSREEFWNIRKDIFQASNCTTHFARIGVEYIYKTFVDLLPTLNKYEFRELLQFMCIFPSAHVPYHYIQMVKEMRGYCKRFGLTEYNVFKKVYDRWWAKEYRTEIEGNLSIVREILFPKCKQLVAARHYDRSCGCYERYIYLKMTNETRQYEDSATIEEEEPVENKTFEKEYFANLDLKGKIFVC